MKDERLTKILLTIVLAVMTGTGCLVWQTNGSVTEMAVRMEYMQEKQAGFEKKLDTLATGTMTREQIRTMLIPLEARIERLEGE